MSEKTVWGDIRHPPWLGAAGWASLALCRADSRLVRWEKQQSTNIIQFSEFRAWLGWELQKSDVTHQDIIYVRLYKTVLLVAIIGDVVKCIYLLWCYASTFLCSLRCRSRLVTHKVDFASGINLMLRGEQKSLCLLYEDTVFLVRIIRT